MEYCTIDLGYRKLKRKREELITRGLGGVNLIENDPFRIPIRLVVYSSLTAHKDIGTDLIGM